MICQVQTVPSRSQHASEAYSTKHPTKNRHIACQFKSNGPLQLACYDPNKFKAYVTDDIKTCLHPQSDCRSTHLGVWDATQGISPTPWETSSFGNNSYEIPQTGTTLPRTHTTHRQTAASFPASISSATKQTNQLATRATFCFTTKPKLVT